jgi:tetratricopeptide (TPR) repeat protein
MKTTLRNIFFLFLLMAAAISSASAQTPPQKSLSKLDVQIVAALDAVKAKKWAEARAGFEAALKTHEKKKSPSEFLFTKFYLPDEDPDERLSDAAEQITQWRHSMGTRQALLIYIAFSLQLEGNAAAAQKQVEAVYGFQSPVWGLSWRVFNVPILKLFYETVPSERTANYGRYLFFTGKLLVDSGEEDGSKFIEQAQKDLPGDKEVAAKLASIYIIRGDAANTKTQAELSLSADPKQPRVLIDLATAEWLLGLLDDAAKHARAASEMAPDLPGPYATMAFVALEKGETAAAVKAAETGERLSEGHVFYQTVLAVCLDASGKRAEAEKLFAKAWSDGLPDEEQLKHWFFRGKALEQALAIIKTLKAP